MTESTTTPAVNQLLRQILFQRGFTTDAQVFEFLYQGYEAGLVDPFLLTDMAPAVERIIKAIESGESIAIYGDYDIDGLTATSLLLDWLGQLGANVIGYIPDRFEEGYGINQAALAGLQKQGIKLVISVDCGITSVAEARWAMNHGLDLIITDHHAVPEVLPQAIAVINPKRPGDKYPFKDLAGVGVAFKLAQAIQQRLDKPALGQEKWLLDLVALGTVCDVVTLVGENRVLVRYGLKVLAKSRRVGIQELAKVARVDLDQISSYHLGFMLGPRLNAAGRLEHAKKALELLTTTDRPRAAALAQELDKLNLERREQQAVILEEANLLAAQYQTDPVLVLASPNWSHGIVGIVASKLVERWHKPTLLLQIMDATAKGSGRSTADFNLVSNLRSLEDMFIKMGGHHFAAGFTIETAKLDRLREALNERAKDLNPTDQGPTSDLELADFGELNLQTIEQLEQLEPFGNGNPKPVMLVPAVRVVKLDHVGADGKHLKLILADEAGQNLSAIGFNLSEEHSNLEVGQQISVWFHLVENNFNGLSKPELVVAKIR